MRPHAVLVSCTLTSLLLAVPARAEEVDHMYGKGHIVIEPRAVQWNIVSAREMNKICLAHTGRPSCAGMASWNDYLHQCIIWTRSPSVVGWGVVEHELRHCQEGRWHD